MNIRSASIDQLIGRDGLGAVRSRAGLASTIGGILGGIRAALHRGSKGIPRAQWEDERRYPDIKMACGSSVPRRPLLQRCHGW